MPRLVKLEEVPVIDAEYLMILKINIKNGLKKWVI